MRAAERDTPPAFAGKQLRRVDFCFPSPSRTSHPTGGNVLSPAIQTVPEGRRDSSQTIHGLVLIIEVIECASRSDAMREFRGWFNRHHVTLTDCLPLD